MHLHPHKMGSLKKAGYEVSSSKEAPLIINEKVWTNLLQMCSKVVMPYLSGP